MSGDKPQRGREAQPSSGSTGTFLKTHSMSHEIVPLLGLTLVKEQPGFITSLQHVLLPQGRTQSFLSLAVLLLARI